jgi:tetratricopeptide (TPR) repeat protein
LVWSAFICVRLSSSALICGKHPKLVSDCLVCKRLSRTRKPDLASAEKIRFLAAMKYRIVIAALLLAGRLSAWQMPAGWATQPPTGAQVSALLDAAATEGWTALAPALRNAALQDYRAENNDAAGAWLNLAYWAVLFGESGTHFQDRWTKAVVSDGLGYAIPFGVNPRPDAPLGEGVSRPLAQWMLSDHEFSDKFFATLSSCDYLPNVLAILDSLYRPDPARFQKYAQLALALAVVDDVPPPPSWPHSQVSAAVLPRKLIPPLEAFAFFTKSDHDGLTLQKLSRLDAETLKFVVDSAAPIPELAWAQKAIDFPLTSLDRAYTAVTYQTQRADLGQFLWPGRTYALADILKTGGICIDEAYFAAETGKGRGVPTMIFMGESQDGRHAWFGYLDDDLKWRMDAGRIPGENVTGIAFDPQTWGRLSDHDLAFLSERFHARPSYRESRFQTNFSRAWLDVGDPAHAVAAARQAVGAEPKNVDAWEALLAATAAGFGGHAPVGDAAQAREGILREAARALEDYPDLSVQYRQRIADSLRARGEASLADNEERLIAGKYRDDRPDLAMAEAVAAMQRAIAEQPLAGQLQTYARLVGKYATPGNTAFYDTVARPFIVSLVAAGHRVEARSALSKARGAISPASFSQLDQEMEKLEQALR